MIIIHAADVHLGSQLGGLDQHDGLPVDRIRSAPHAALHAIADLCEQRGAALLLLAGDLFDRDAPLAVVLEATTILKRIAAAGTRVVLIRGNHDALAKMQRRLPTLDGVAELPTDRAGTIVFDDLGVAVHGRGFDTQHVPENIVVDYPARIDGHYNIGVLHTSLEGSATHAVYAPCHVDDLVAHGYDYWALGHIHQHAIVRAGAPWVVYAGSPQGRHVGEVGEHGVYVLQVDDGALVGEPEHVELATVRWHQVAIEPAGPDDDAAAIVATVATRLDELARQYGADVLHVVRLTIEGRCAAHHEFMREPGRWRDELQLAASGIAGADVCLERVRVRTRANLDDPAVLRERQDFVGDLANHLTGDAVATLARPEALVKLDAKLRGLAADGDGLRDRAIDSAEIERAGAELLARLLDAQQRDLEEER